jgi:hypothetical protein
VQGIYVAAHKGGFAELFSSMPTLSWKVLKGGFDTPIAKCNPIRELENMTATGNFSRIFSSGWQQTVPG